jgi:hypothetical protein
VTGRRALTKKTPEKKTTRNSKTVCISKADRQALCPCHLPHNASSRWTRGVAPRHPPQVRSPRITPFSHARTRVVSARARTHAGWVASGVEQGGCVCVEVRLKEWYTCTDWNKMCRPLKLVRTIPSNVTRCCRTHARHCQSGVGAGGSSVKALLGR